MRALGWSVAAFFVVGSSVGLADDAKPKTGGGKGKDDAAKVDAIDISAYRDDLVVLTDDDGVIYVARPKVIGREGGPVFVGDGKVFYEQYSTGGGSDGTKNTWSYALWAPRVAGYDDAVLWTTEDKKFFISCGQDRKTELRPVGKKDADRMLKDAAFRPKLFDRKPHLLARDDTGVYYYVDIDIDARASNTGSNDERRYQHGHRVFVGKKGAMKQLPMTNIVADSEGEIYETKRGELQIVTEADTKTGTWVRGRKKTTLKILDRADNRYLIYRELGIYGFIGTACEEL
jgi:hypothetical protein